MTAERDPFEVALAALRRKERASAELTRWLERRGYGSAEVSTAIERLTEAGELDDERFARRYAEDKRELSGWGGERIRQALLDRGVESSLVDVVLASDSPGGELERASELLMRRGRPLTEDADRQRALEYLARRGYDYEIAYQAVRRAAPPRAA